MDESYRIASNPSKSAAKPLEMPHVTWLRVKSGKLFKESLNVRNVTATVVICTNWLTSVCKPSFFTKYSTSPTTGNVASVRSKKITEPMPSRWLPNSKPA